MVLVVIDRAHEKTYKLTSTTVRYGPGPLRPRLLRVEVQKTFSREQLVGSGQGFRKLLEGSLADNRPQLAHFLGNALVFGDRDVDSLALDEDLISESPGRPFEVHELGRVEPDSVVSQGKRQLLLLLPDVLEDLHVVEIIIIYLGLDVETGSVQIIPKFCLLVPDVLENLDGVFGRLVVVHQERVGQLPGL